MLTDEQIAELKQTAATDDLSAEIARTVPRGASEQVTCRRISRSHYRCNWWSPQDTQGYDNPSMRGSLVTTSRICQSQFLNVTKDAGQLNIRILSSGGTSTAVRK